MRRFRFSESGTGRQPDPGPSDAAERRGINLRDLQGGLERRPEQLQFDHFGLGVGLSQEWVVTGRDVHWERLCIRGLQDNGDTQLSPSLGECYILYSTLQRIGACDPQGHLRLLCAVRLLWVHANDSRIQSVTAQRI